jgi:glycine cleavage system H lipoate-binding protein
MVALFVILTIVVCVMADSIVQWAKAKKEDTAQAPGRLVPAYAFEDVTAPAGVFLDPGHTWMHLTHSGTAHVGVDGFAQKVMGRIDGVELPAVGDEVRRGDKLFTIRHAIGLPCSTRQSTASSTGGQGPNQDPEAINTDPYAMGWICSQSEESRRESEAVAVADEESRRSRARSRDFRSSCRRPLGNMALGQVLRTAASQPAGA